jgi:Transglutaminase-like domain
MAIWLFWEPMWGDSLMAFTYYPFANHRFKYTLFNMTSGFQPSIRKVWIGATMAIFVAAQVHALTFSDLLSDLEMNPKRFAGYFTDFDFDLHPFDVQDPEVFLETRKGDCIDYAVMADYVLKRDGYATRLIRVEMIGKNMGHAVCFVTQSAAYLDYNNRKYFIKLAKSGPRLRDIATKVAESFDANWTFASEFTYTYKEDVKHAVMTVVKTDPPDTDPDSGSPTAARAKAGS